MGKLLSISNWKAIIKCGDIIIKSVFVGSHSDNLFFETRQVLKKSDFLLGENPVDFQIFFPKAFLDGKGILNNDFRKKNEKDYFYIKPEKMFLKQNREYKRFYIFEKARIKCKIQELNVIVKDISYKGLGVLSDERFICKEGLIEFSSDNLSLEIEMKHEWTDFSFFQYGFSIKKPDKFQIHMLRSYIERVQNLLKNSNIEL